MRCERRDGLVGIEQRLRDLPLDGDRLDRGSRLLGGVGGDGGDGLAGEVRLLGEGVEVPEGDRVVDPRQRQRRREVQRAHATPRRAGCASTAAWSIPGSTTSAV